MSEVELQGDYVQPVDLSRAVNLAMILIGFIALAAAVWLAFGSYEKSGRLAQLQREARWEVKAATEERDRAIAQRNAAIAEVEELKAGQTGGATDASVARVDADLAELEEMTDQVRKLAVANGEVTGEQLLPQLNAIRTKLDELHKYVQAGRSGKDAAPAPELVPSNWERDQPPARLIHASLNVAAPDAYAPLDNAAGLSLARTKLYVVLGMLGILGLMFLSATVVVFTSRNERRLAFATDTIKTLMGFFIGVVTAFMGMPG